MANQDKGHNRHGANAEDIILRVPSGTVVRDQSGEVLADLVIPGDTYVIARGGRGWIWVMQRLPPPTQSTWLCAIW